MEATKLDVGIDVVIITLLEGNKETDCCSVAIALRCKTRSEPSWFVGDGPDFGAMGCGAVGAMVNKGGATVPVDSRGI